MTITHIAKRPALSARIPSPRIEDAFSIERSAPSISPTHAPVETTIEVSADDVNTSSVTSVWDWAHLRYADDELDEFDAMLDGKPRW